MELLTEAEAAQRYRTQELLESGGNYGCRVLVVDPSSKPECCWTCDDCVSALKRRHAPHDIGTVLVDGDLLSDTPIDISDQLMCFVVTGNVLAPAMHIYETEVCVYGDLELGSLDDDDDYLRVKGTCRIGLR